ncbi:MAG: cytochrome c biogenesis protein CcsA [Candidatus Krumholzibacteria bacterium]|nr:cytochrome c biogenesis protein CcsA [Candidatus Krumholzibacteria bacterium]
MKSFGLALSYLLPALYFCAVLLYFLIFFRKKKHLEYLTTYFLGVLVAVHVVNMTIRWFALHVVPVSTVFDAMSFLAFAILVVYFIIELSIKNKASGFFIMSFAFVAEVTSAINYNWKPETNELLTNTPFAIHASLNIVGYTALSLSAIYALLYIIQNRNMKLRRFNVIYDQLPALTYLEMMSIRSVLIGIVLTGCGLMLGHYQTHQVFDKIWLSDPKVIVSDLVWLFYVLGYIGARVFRWRGRWMAYLSLSGFTALMLGGVIVVFFADSFHEFF